MIKIGEFITIDPDIRFGKPCITGTRVAVSDILKWLSSGMSFAEIINDYPKLNEEHIKAALNFAANREEITRLIAA
ncbi:MAG TPA: DUF433 domain-containing protein [Bacteroidales bacterium]